MSDKPKNLIERYQDVLARVERACQSAGRDSDEVTLLAVSKTRPAAHISEVHQHGQLDFGENYVQEWMEKDEALASLRSEGLRWHIIGPLQRNKCKYVSGQVALIHTVHSIRLAHELEKRTPDGSRQPILLQVNTAEEESKSGLTTMGELVEIATHPWQNLEIQGLMTIPPYHEDPERSRGDFIATRRWKEQLEEAMGQPLPHLSMGMSHDLEVAIAEGATIVRVGTAIFGPRS